jgi:HSP20 family molecular chaperone IbpA
VLTLVRAFEPLPHRKDEIMKGVTLDHIFISLHEIRPYRERALSLVEQRAYEIYKTHGSGLGHAVDDWVQAESELLQSVNAEASDAGEAFVVVASVPGYRPEDLKASVEPRCLTICGLAGNQMSNSSQSQFARFFLSFRLPADVNTSAVSAHLEKDVLEVRLPKVLPRKAE